MNCETIDAILDDHRTARLAQPERQAVVAHLESCVRCADSWAANDALSGEELGEPSQQLLLRVQRLATGLQARPCARRGGALAAAAAATATLLVVLVAGRSWLAAPDPSVDRVPEATESPAARVFLAGRDYELLARPAAPTAADKIPVTEFFMWPCNHCYAFEAELEGWAARSSDVVALTRVPVVFNPQAEMLARAFYAADALGKSAAMHAAFYEEIHERGNPLSSRGALTELFARFDVAAATFADVFDSAAIDAQVQRAAALGRQYEVNEVPTLVVAGRYSTSPSLAGVQVLAVVDELVGQAAEQDSLRSPAVTDAASQAPAPRLEDLLRKVDRVEDYARLLERAADPAAPPFVRLALERARAELSPTEIALAEQRYRERRGTSGR